MSTMPIPTNLSDLLSKLTILSLIKEGEKINLSTMSFVDGNSWYSFFSRYYNRENRFKLIEMLQNTVQETIRNIEDYGKTDFLPYLINHLTSARVGIVNLTSTYKEDPNMLAKLNVILENIDLQISKNVIV